MPTGLGSRATAFFVAAFLAFLAQTARAQSNAEVSATAESLFREGKDLMEQQKYEEACAKLEGSFELEPMTGTLLNLANCHELLGRTASAWAEFLRVSSMARSAGQQDREQVARDRAQLLEPKLMRLRIVVPEAVLAPGLQIQRDRVPVEGAAWSSPIPVDPGKHTITVQAPGKVTASHQVELTTPGATVEFEVPPLEDEAAPPPVLAPTPVPAPAPPPPASPPPRQPLVIDSGSDSSQSTLGWIVGAVGVAGLGVGATFGVLAQDRWEEAEAEGCADGGCPTATGQAASEDANDLATYGTIGAIGGGALVVTGIVLILTAPSEGETASVPSLRAVVAGDGAWIGWGGGF